MIKSQIKYNQYDKVMRFYLSRENACILDGENTSSKLSRYSYLADLPFARLVLTQNKLLWNEESMDISCFWDLLDEKLEEYVLPVNSDLPPFYGGVMGWFSYGLVKNLESYPGINQNKEQEPLVSLAWYDVVVVFDHFLKKAWVFSSGFPEKNLTHRKLRAQERLNQVLEQISRSDQELEAVVANSLGDLKQSYDEDEYISMVEKAQEYIRSGDVFEVNLSLQYSMSVDESLQPGLVYQQLRAMNPAPFSCFIRHGEYSLISSSPELFLKKNQDNISAHPIKGTIKRKDSFVEDQFQKSTLSNSEKDRAENIMIVDLMRNDLSKVCSPYSIKVPKLCQIETFETVHHLVSIITGCLEKNIKISQIIQACFPGGSITGAPKTRAMEIIDELENYDRGLYCGSAGYIGFNGNMELSILIRSIVMDNDTLKFSAGGAITLDSDPKSEYEESLLKAKAIISTLERVRDGSHH